MGGLFNLENPFMQFLNRLTDVIILNVLCLVCCLPIITAGASLSALHYITLKMVKNEEGYVFRGFFKAFKDNFKQGTIIWSIFLVISVLFRMDIRILEAAGDSLPSFLQVIIYSLYMIVCLIAMYVFPLISRFNNTIRNSIKNAFLMCIIHIPKSLIMAVIYILPLIIILLFPVLIPVYLLIGFSGPAYVNSYFWKGIFKKYEPEEEIVEEERTGEEITWPEESSLETEE